MWRSVTKWFLSAAEFQWRREEIGIELEEHFSKQHNSIRLWLFSTFFYHLHSVLGWIQICQNIRVYLSNSNFYLETSESLSIFLFIASFISLAWSLFYNWQWAVIIRPKFVSQGKKVEKIPNQNFNQPTVPNNVFLRNA